MFVLLSDVVKSTNASKYGDKSSPTKELRKLAPIGSGGRMRRLSRKSAKFNKARVLTLRSKNSYSRGRFRSNCSS